VLERRKREFELVAQRYGELEHPADYSWLIIPNWSLPEGWSKQTTQLLVLLPPGYPQTPPDSFYTEVELTLAGGAEPGAASGRMEHNGRTWRQFSWHFVDASEWQPHPDLEQSHTLLTFMAGVEQRLAEAS
jgi:hypothetical protein